MRNRLLIVGPLTSQHIQAWYSKFCQPAKVTVATVHDGGKPLPDGFGKFRFQPTGSRLDFILFAPVFFFFWWRYRPQVTNFHYLSSYGLLSLLVPKKNLILNVWGSDVNLTYQSKNPIKRWLVKRALQRFSWINAPAQHIKQKLIALGADEKRIEVFQYGVDVAALPTTKTNDNAMLTLVSNRNWQPLYRIGLIIEGFCLWQQSSDSIDAQLLVYGGGSDTDSKVIDDILQCYPKVQHKVVIKGYTDKKQMLQQISDADIFVSVPVRDGTPLSLLEAMYIGLLPVVSDIDANREWLQQDAAIWLCDNSALGMSDAFRQAAEKLPQGQWQQLNRRKVVDLADVETNLTRFYNVLSHFYGAN